MSHEELNRKKTAAEQRLGRKITQQELAEIADVSQAQVSKILHGKVRDEEAEEKMIVYFATVRSLSMSPNAMPIEPLKGAKLILRQVLDDMRIFSVFFHGIEEARIFHATDDAMHTLATEGDTIVVIPQEMYVHLDPVIAEVRGEIVFRYFFQPTDSAPPVLVADDFRNYREIPLDGNVEIIGRKVVIVRI